VNFCHKEIDGPLVFDENHPGILVVENQKAFTQVLTDLMILTEDDEADCGIYENFEPIKASKRVEVIVNPLAVDPNQKKILNALYAILEKEMWKADNFAKSMELCSRISSYLAELTLCTDYPVVFTEQMSGNALLKAADIHLETEEGTLLERLDSYMSAVGEFLKKDVFFFVGLHSYLTPEELQLLYRSASYKKNKLILLEGFQPEPLPEEAMLVLDKDLCQLNLGWKNEN
jgi:CRISPR-associated protein Csn2